MSEWISIADELPDLERDVLCYCGNGNGRPCVVAALFENNDRTIEWNCYDDPKKDLTGAITHWMPMPQPPKD